MINEKQKLIKAILIIGILLLTLYFTFTRGFYAFSDKCVDIFSGEITESIRYFMDYDVWALGDNRYHEHIFVYEDEALELAKIKFSDIFDSIYDVYHEEYKLSKINKCNLTTYRKLIEELPIATEKELQNRNYCLDFIDIYINTLKRYKFVPNRGLIRTYPY